MLPEKSGEGRVLKTMTWNSIIRGFLSEVGIIWLQRCVRVSKNNIFALSDSMQKSDDPKFLLKNVSLYVRRMQNVYDPRVIQKNQLSTKLGSYFPWKANLVQSNAGVVLNI